MKNLYIVTTLIILLFNFSCKKERIDTVINISGMIKNSKDSVLTIALGGKNKKIKLTSEGRFKDTLKVQKTKLYRMYLSRSKSGFIFLKNGYNLKLTGDADDFFFGFTYTGEGSDSNNLLIAQHSYSKKTGTPKNFLSLNEADFKQKIKKVNRGIDSINNFYTKADTILVNIAKKNKDRFTFIIENMYYQNYNFK